MSDRSPEVSWQMALPMMILLGFTLHLPLILQSLSLLPTWATLNKDVALLLIWSSIFGCSISGVIYLSNFIPKPVRFPLKPLQNLLAYDFYTPKIYRMSIVMGVDMLSKLTDTVDRFIFDGIVNLVGLVSILSGESLKYSTSGRTQFYTFTVLIGVSVLGMLVTWQYWGDSLFNLMF
jgi:NAD(P)H-quinone oxidoreductase subunit 5